MPREAGTLPESTAPERRRPGIPALPVSAIDGIIGGHVPYFAAGGKFNPMIGIAGVSCVPATAKAVREAAAAANPGVIVLPRAPGASISGAITPAIIAAAFIATLKYPLSPRPARIDDGRRRPSP